MDRFCLLSQPSVIYFLSERPEEARVYLTVIDARINEIRVPHGFQRLSPGNCAYSGQIYNDDSLRSDATNSA
jgi:hypothetical protein